MENRLEFQSLCPVLMPLMIELECGKMLDNLSLMINESYEENYV